MIGSMFALCAANGASVDTVENKLEKELWPTWVNSVIVWGPVQIGQQTLAPSNRVAVANGVSYVWDTYLSLKMMRRPPRRAAEAHRRSARRDWRGTTRVPTRPHMAVRAGPGAAAAAASSSTAPGPRRPRAGPHGAP